MLLWVWCYQQSLLTTTWWNENNVASLCWKQQQQNVRLRILWGLLHWLIWRFLSRRHFPRSRYKTKLWQGRIPTTFYFVRQGKFEGRHLLWQRIWWKNASTGILALDRWKGYWHSRHSSLGTVGLRGEEWHYLESLYIMCQRIGLNDAAYWNFWSGINKKDDIGA